MLPKPHECCGCPLAGDMQGFVPDEIVDAPVLILAQGPGADEEAGMKVVGHEYAGRRRVAVKEPYPRGPAPLIGETGHQMEQDYFPVAGLERGKVSLANVLKCRQIVGGKRTNDLPTGKILARAVEHCTAAHLRIPEHTKLIVAMGALSAKFLGCPGSVSAWRGFTFQRRMP